MVYRQIPRSILSALALSEAKGTINAYNDVLAGTSLEQEAWLLLNSLVCCGWGMGQLHGRRAIPKCSACPFAPANTLVLSTARLQTGPRLQLISWWLILDLN